jgi:hypothetical protein
MKHCSKAAEIRLQSRESRLKYISLINFNGGLENSAERLACIPDGCFKGIKPTEFLINATENGLPTKASVKTKH